MHTAGCQGRKRSLRPIQGCGHSCACILCTAKPTCKELKNGLVEHSLRLAGDSRRFKQRADADRIAGKAVYGVVGFCGRAVGVAAVDPERQDVSAGKGDKAQAFQRGLLISLHGLHGLPDQRTEAVFNLLIAAAGLRACQINHGKPVAVGCDR